MEQGYHFKRSEAFLERGWPNQVCNVCHGPLYPRLSKVQDPITRESFTILACESCGLGHTMPQPEKLGKYYGKDYYGSRHGATRAYCLRRSLRIVSHAGNKPEDGRLLDVGCGDGSFMLAAQSAGWNVTGTELNPHPARRLGLYVKKSIAGIGDVAQFDCITMWHTLEHFRDIKSTLTSLERLLAPKGRLIIAVPDNGSLQARLFGAKWLHLDVPRHLYHFDNLTLRACLDQTGFIPLQCRHLELEYSLIGWSQSALNHISQIPNAFFNVLTGKRKIHSPGTITANVILGSILTAACVPAVLIETLLGFGGTLVMVVSKNPKKSISAY